MKALLGRKLGMTSIFDQDGNSVPVTLVEAGPCVVTQVKTAEKDGYSAVQLGFGSAKKNNRPQMGHLKAANATPSFLREIRLSEINLEVGSQVGTELFEAGDKVKVTGISKGKGFAGTIKRHNFSRGPKSHGSKNYRKPGSIGSIFPMRVIKGLKMAGHKGAEQTTTRGLKIEQIVPDKNLLAIKGAVPGPNKGYLVIRGEHE